MNRLLPILLFLSGFILAENSFSQSVSNDLTFNSDDIGFDYGKGCDQRVRASAVLPNGKIIIAGDFNTVNGSGLSIARLDLDGSVDTTFHPPVLNLHTIYDLKIQLDGKIVFVGQFSLNNNGLPQSNITRLNADGSPDSTFIMNHSTNGEIRTVAIQADGKLIIGGYFESVWSQNVGYIARLNSNGTLDTSFVCTGTNWIVHTCNVQTDGKILVGGGFSSINGIPSNRLARLNSDGSLDSTFDIGSGFSGYVSKVEQQLDGKLLVSGSFLTFNGTNCNHIVRILIDGTMDITFNSTSSLSSFSNDRIYSFAVQGDNKILISGVFNLISSSVVTDHYIARLETDGTLDETYAENEVNGEVTTCSLQPDGKLIIGGSFQYVGGLQKDYIARLNEDGLQDSTFNWGLGVNGVVYGSALQSDGKTILVGSFSQVNGVTCKNIVRLDSTGQMDPTFQLIPISLYADLKTCLIQPDGKLIIVGDYCTIFRLNQDGTLDLTFNSPFQNYTGSIKTCLLYTDGRIFVGGDFYNSLTGNFSSVARLFPNGNFDSGFYLGLGPNNTILTSVLQVDGKIIIGGEFTEVNNTPRMHLARLLADGALDNSYNPTTNNNFGSVTSCTLQSDGKLIIGGDFSIVNNVPNRTLARLNENGSLDLSFQTDGGLYGRVNKIVVLPSGKILACGPFSTNNFLQLSCFARFQSNGELDYTFNTGNGPNSPWINTFEIQPDEKIIVAGGFTAFDGVGRNRVTRLEVCQSTLGPDTTVVECNNFTWANGKTYYLSGNYLRILPNYLGCDSILLLNLTLNHTNSLTNVTACGSYTWTNGQTYSQTGLYSQTLVNSMGCDSIANLYVIILQKPNSIVQNNQNGTLTVMANYGQWIDCVTNLPIPGATSNLFAPTQNGSYACVLSMNGCSDTSDCVSIMDLGVGSYTDQEFSVMPNPTNDQVHINFSGSDAELTVYDLQGKVVLKDQIQNQGIISLQNFERGVYLFDFKNSQGHSVQRVVKQ